MPAPLSSPSSQVASMTSSGFADGLGRRALAFDREEGVMLERLVLRPELGAFETMLRDRLDRLATLEDERIARPRTIERDLDGSLVVVSEFVPGSRLSDLLETAAEAGVTPGVDASLGFLLDVLPALCCLHAGAGFAHGSIAPSRTVLTPAGQIVLLDAIYGGALTHLRYGRRKLWTEFAAATSPRLPTQRLHVETDIAQAALAAVMLILGRPLHADEYPDGIAAVVGEVIDVAEIRGSGQFAARFQSFLDRALQQRAGAPYTSADDALFDVRELASELGLHVCRRALVDFIEQMESPAGPRRIENLDDDLASFGLDADHEASMLAAEDQDLDGTVDAQLDIDSLADGAPDDPHELTAMDVFAETVAVVPVAEEEVDWVAAAAESTRGESDRLAPPTEPPAAAAPDAAREVSPSPEPQPVEVPVSDAAEAVRHEEQENPGSVETAAASIEEGDNKPVPSRRAKRATRSARARKDKLRSAAAASAPALARASAAPAPAPAAKKSSSPWLVAPGRAADFEPIVETAPVPAALAMPAPVTAAPPLLVATVLAPGEPPAAVPPVPLYAAPPPLPPPPQPPQPQVVETAFSRTVGAIAPSYDTPPAWTPPPVTAQMPPVVSAQPQLTQLKMKDSGSRTRATRSESVSSDIYSTPLSVAIEAEAPPGGFPWKLVAALAVIVVGAVIGGRAYLPARGAAEDEHPPAAVAASTPPPAAAAPAAVPGTTTGRLEIETQPAGARILIDGKAAGESPVALDGIAVGRHTVTLISSSGSIKRTVRIEAGRTARLDVPIFSGWVGIYAPFVVEVVEGGRVIGTTDEPRLMLSPGRHELTLVNRDLGYSSSQSVDIEPGEVRSISIDPRGTVNFNATPWAEVWIDGRKVGDTPIANLQLQLGTREVTFRHPQLGERRVSVTVKGGPSSAVSIDLTKPGN